MHGGSKEKFDQIKNTGLHRRWIKALFHEHTSYFYSCQNPLPNLPPRRLGVDRGRSIATVYKPELLAPAGNWQCARAAVENGADAIFFGLDRFNARMRGENFTEAELPELMAYLHARGVRGYVTFCFPTN